MSPQGGRQASGKGRGGSASGQVAARRIGLLAFGAVFLVLFVIVAIAEGLGDPSVPSDSIALVEDAPGDLGDVTQAKFDHAVELAAAQSGLKSVPEPSDPQYAELKQTALDSLFEAIWLQGLAEEMGIVVSEKEQAAELAKLKEESFKSEAEFKKFLKEQKYTQADVDERIVLQKLSTDIQAEVSEEAPEPSQREIENYYDAAKAAQFTQPESRDLRLVVNKDRAKADQAAAALSKDNTASNWQKVAEKYSEDAATKDKGGVQEGVTEGRLGEPLDAAIFNAPEGRVEGPVKAQSDYTVFEVTNTTPGSFQELKAVEGQIKSTLAQQAEQEYFAAFVANFTSTWRARTFCAEDYLTERCANFKGSGHPATAPPACYEADPDGGRPEACPAPVFQLIPAMPGSITPLEPQGKPLAQRPQPVPGSEEAPAGAEGLPEGVPPPAEAPPSE